MNPTEIISGCNRDGIELGLTNDGMIAYAGPEYALLYWLPILAAHKSAVVNFLRCNELPVEPEPEQDAEPSQQCRNCAHFATPGLSSGYCGQRDDLPPAYGINHPLKRLPDDLGISCSEFSTKEF